jgi:Ca2+-binding EF-hand superfamily protein
MSAPIPKEELVKKLSKAHGKARLEDLVQDLTNAFGGTRKIAKHVYDEFDHGKPGGITRAKLLDMYVRLLTQTAKKETNAPLTEMTEDDLLRLLDNHLNHAAETTAKPPEASDGKAPGT